ncbi:MAG: inositol monophosphatase family protein [Planctomycetota bacterium]|nr:inositol monophosphatase family protein [Planctomycetota bacterium]
MPSYIEVCEQAARAGAAVLVDWVGRFKIREKGPADLVTEADLAAQEAIKVVILTAFPDHDVLGEEDQAFQERKSEFRWVVDPLDGTTNYAHAVPHYCVSIALEHQGNLLAATIIDPNANECYLASAGEGAYLNGEPMRVSTASSVTQALVACGFPPNVRRSDREIQDFIRVLAVAQGIRRTGSAALNLAYVAAGRFDGFWARETKSWDVAAGALLVKEAGGIMTGIDGTAFSLDRPQFLAAATLPLHQEMLKLINADLP